MDKKTKTKNESVDNFAVRFKRAVRAVQARTLPSRTYSLDFWRRGARS